MGGGYWDSGMYTTSASSRKSMGVDDFDYDSKVKTGAVTGIHESLDPRKIKNGIRESRDSADHPNSLPVAVFFDVTGSMGGIPRVLQGKLSQLMDVVIAKAKIPDPQVLVGAIGDYHCDKYPLQVGQFESDNRFDEQLRAIILEGGGGGQTMESYSLAYRFAAHHTATDAFDKRGKKGYFFTIGDEFPWPTVTKAELKTLFNVEAEEDDKVEDLIAKASERWEIYHIFPLESGYGTNDAIKSRWRELLGERVIMLDDQTLICETIASLIYMMETAKDLSSVVVDVGLKGKNLDSVKNALVPVSNLCAPAHLADGNLPADLDVAESVTRI